MVGDRLTNGMVTIKRKRVKVLASTSPPTSHCCSRSMCSFVRVVSFREAREGGRGETFAVKSFLCRVRSLPRPSSPSLIQTDRWMFVV